MLYGGSVAVAVVAIGTVVLIHWHTQEVYRHNQEVYKQAKEQKYNQYLSIGKKALSKNDYELAIKEFNFAIHQSLTIDELKQSSQLLGWTILKFAQSNESKSVSPNINNEIQNVLNIFNNNGNTNEKGLVEYSIGLLDEKKGLEIVKQGNWSSAITQLSNARAYYYRAQSDGVNIENVKSKIDHELGTIQVKYYTKKAEKQWNNGNDEQAIQTLELAMGKNGDKSDLLNAQSLLNNYKSNLSAILREKALQEQQQKLASEKANMKKFEGNGNVEIAAGGVEIHQSTDLHTAGNGWTFIYVDAAVLNVGSDPIDANPLYFTLSAPDGQTASVDDDSYDLNSYFNDTNLQMNQQCNGWLIFYVPQASQYTLNYSDLNGNTAEKTVIVS